MELMNLDKSKVKQIAEASRTATVSMLALGMRERAHVFTNISSFKGQLQSMGEKVNDRDYMDFWRGLENAGVGSIILGRRGKQTRFEWHYSLRQIAQIAIDGKTANAQKLVPILPKRQPAQVLKAIAQAPKPEPKKKKEEIEVCILPTADRETLKKIIDLCMKALDSGQA